MSIDHEAIARKLRQARALQSLPVETVSRETSIASERIKVIESGEDRPSGDEVLILANYYRHYFRDFNIFKFIENCQPFTFIRLSMKIMNNIQRIINDGLCAGAPFSFGEFDSLHVS